MNCCSNRQHVEQLKQPDVQLLQYQATRVKAGETTDWLLQLQATTTARCATKATRLACAPSWQAAPGHSLLAC